jgi:putative flippase GtrA
MIRHFFTRQFALFLFVGGTAAFINWSTRLAISSFFSFPAAVSIAYMAGMASAFALNRFFVFNRSERPILKQARDFISINVIFMPIVLLSSIFIEKILRYLGMTSYTETIAHGLSVSLPAILSFLLYKFVAFKETRSEHQ